MPLFSDTVRVLAILNLQLIWVCVWESYQDARRTMALPKDTRRAQTGARMPSNWTGVVGIRIT